MGDDEAKGGKDTRTKRVIKKDVDLPLPEKGEPWLLAGFEVDKFHLVCPEKENRNKNDIKKEDNDKKYSHCMLLNELIFLINTPAFNISIIGMEGRASETGPWNNNYYLSKRRVEEVQKYLRTHGKINVKKVRFLGQKSPIIRPAGPGPHNLEIDTNRSVRIYIRHPPLAVARVIGHNNIELNRRTAYYYPTDNSVSPEFITLDGKESRHCKDFPIISYLWEHIETRFRGGPNPNEVVELLPWHSSSVKGDEAYHNPGYEESRKKYRGMSDHDVVKFRLHNNLLDVLRNNNTIVLTFRLTVTDVDNLKDSTTVDVTITPISLRRNLILHEWGINMQGSVSLKALKLGIQGDVSVGRTSVGVDASAGIGGAFAIGVLKRYSDNSEKIIIFVGLAGGFGLKAGAKKGIDAVALTLIDPRKLAKIRRLKDLKDLLKDFLKDLDITIDDPWQEFTKFQCDYSTFEHFDSNNAEMRNFDLHAPIVGKGWGYIKFTDTRTYPDEEIDIGGYLAKNTTMLGFDYEKSIYGKVYIF